MQLDSYDDPEAELLLGAGERRLQGQLRRRRERLAAGIGALAFVAAAGTMAVVLPWHRSLPGSTLALVLLTWLLVERVRFPVAGGWTRATMLAFVPALFV